MTIFFAEYLSLLIFIVISSVFSFIFFFLSYIVATQKADTEKLSAYECGSGGANTSTAQVCEFFRNSRSPKGLKTCGYRRQTVGGARFRLFSSTVKYPKSSSNSSGSKVLDNKNSFEGCVAKLNLPSLESSNLIRAIGHMSTLAHAHDLIKSKSKISRKKLHALSKLILAGQYKFGAARLILIAKTGKSEERPLTRDEKIVEKAIQLVLNEFYEPIFLNCSHGYRPNRGCLSALKELDRRFRGAKWVINADLTKSFDCISCDRLMTILKRTIQCTKTLTLIKSGLTAGYFYLGNLVVGELIGIPEGSVINPILCNIYLHELDLFVSSIIEKSNKGSTRRKNPVYRKLLYEVEKLKKNGFTAAEMREVRLKTRKVHSKDPMDSNFVRIGYVRYADAFVISFISPRSLAVDVMTRVQAFLFDELGLELNSKTTLLDFNDGIKFLGAVITNRKVKEKPLILSGRRPRANPNKVVKSKQTPRKIRVTPRLSFHAPILVLLKRLVVRGYFKWRVNPHCIRPTAMRSMVNVDHRRILLLYNSVINGIMTYYKFADNRKSLGIITHGLKLSCALTLALKFKLRTLRKVFKTYGPLLAEPICGVMLRLPATHKRLSHLERFKLGGSSEDLSLEDIIRRSYVNSWTVSVSKQPCVICGSFEGVEAHHVQKLRELRKRSHLDFFAMHMAAVKRKQVALCSEHHQKLHHNQLNEDERQAFVKGIRNNPLN